MTVGIVALFGGRGEFFWGGWVGGWGLYIFLWGFCKRGGEIFGRRGRENCKLSRVVVEFILLGE